MASALGEVDADQPGVGPGGGGGPALADPWAGIVDPARIRAELGFRPIYPTVWSARDAGAL